MSRGSLHGGFVQRLMDVPEIGTIDGRPFPAIQNTVLIQLPTGGIPRVKVIGRYRRRSNGNIFGKPGVQSSQPLARRPLPLNAEACHLTEGVHARVGTSRADHWHGFLGQLKQRGFDGLLDGGLIGLALPSGIAGTIVFEDQSHGRHSGGARKAWRIIAPAVLKRPKRRLLPHEGIQRCV